MDVHLDQSDLVRLAADFETAAGMTNARASAAVRRTGLQMEALGKLRAPVDTGNLRNSISTSTAAGGLRAEVTAWADYSAYVEFGTSRMAGQPFLGPAADQGARELMQALGDVGGDIP